MSGSVLGTGLQFLGPAIAAGITLIVGVMAFYFLSVSREYRIRGVNGPPQGRQLTTGEQHPNEPMGPPWVMRWDPVQPSQVSFRSDVRRAGGSEGQPQVELPAYHVENHPAEKWGTRVEAPPAIASVCSRTDA